MRKIIKLIIFLAIITGVIFGTGISYDLLVERLLPLEYEEYIETYARENGLDKYLVMGLIKSESNFETDAHSGVASGLMQITDDTAKWIAGELKIEYTLDMVLDAETNIKMGCFYLSYLIDRYKNTETALAAYNAGMGNVSSWLEDERYSQDGITLYEIPYSETRKYVKKVALFKKLYEKTY